MTRRPSGKSFRIIVPALMLLVLAVMLPKGHASAMPENDLAARIASFNLGMNNYIIGSRLTTEQKKIAADNIVDDSYDGTYKFHDGDLFVVASREDNTVLAVYRRNETAGMAEAKEMIAGLMGMFAEPTAMAHDKLIYWAYNDGGKIPEDTYNASRQDEAGLDILATVKFASSFEITAEPSDSQEPGIIYYIITSDPLIRRFIDQQ